MKNTRRKYDAEFKHNVVLLTHEEGRSVKEVVGSLGIPSDLLYQWRRRLAGRNSFPRQWDSSFDS